MSGTLDGTDNRTPRSTGSLVDWKLIGNTGGGLAHQVARGTTERLSGDDAELPDDPATTWKPFFDSADTIFNDDDFDWDTVEDAPKDSQMRADVVKAAKLMHEMTRDDGEAAPNMSDDEWIAFAKDEISWFTQNTVGLGKWAVRLGREGTTMEQKQAFGFIMQMHEHSAVSLRDVGNFLYKGLLADPTTYIGIGTLGVGTAAAQGGKLAAKQAIKTLLKESIEAGIKRGVTSTVAKQALRETLEVGAKTAARSEVRRAYAWGATKGAMKYMVTGAGGVTSTLKHGVTSVAEEGLGQGLKKAWQGTLTSQVARHGLSRGFREGWQTGSSKIAIDGVMQGMYFDAGMQSVRQSVGLQENFNAGQMAFSGGLGYVFGDAFGAGFKSIGVVGRKVWDNISTQPANTLNSGFNPFGMFGSKNKGANVGGQAAGNTANKTNKAANKANNNTFPSVKPPTVMQDIGEVLRTTPYNLFHILRNPRKEHNFHAHSRLAGRFMKWAYQPYLKVATAYYKVFNGIKYSRLRNIRFMDLDAHKYIDPVLKSTDEVIERELKELFEGATASNIANIQAKAKQLQEIAQKISDGDPITQHQADINKLTQEIQNEQAALLPRITEVENALQPVITQIDNIERLPDVEAINYRLDRINTLYAFVGSVKDQATNLKSSVNTFTNDIGQLNQAQNLNAKTFSDRLGEIANSLETTYNNAVHNATAAPEVQAYKGSIEVPRGFIPAAKMRRTWRTADGAPAETALIKGQFRAIYDRYHNPHARSLEIKRPPDKPHNAENDFLVGVGMMDRYLKKEDGGYNNVGSLADVSGYRGELAGYLANLYRLGFEQDAIRLIRLIKMHEGGGSLTLIPEGLKEAIKKNLESSYNKNLSNDKHLNHFMDKLDDVAYYRQHAPIPGGVRDTEKWYIKKAMPFYAGRAYPNAPITSDGNTVRGAYVAFPLSGGEIVAKYVIPLRQKFYSFITGGNLISADEMNKIREKAGKKAWVADNNMPYDVKDTGMAIHRNWRSIPRAILRWGSGGTISNIRSPLKGKEGAKWYYPSNWRTPITLTPVGKGAIAGTMLWGAALGVDALDGRAEQDDMSIMKGTGATIANAATFAPRVFYGNIFGKERFHIPWYMGEVTPQELSERLNQTYTNLNIALNDQTLLGELNGDDETKKKTAKELLIKYRENAVDAFNDAINVVTKERDNIAEQNKIINDAYKIVDENGERYTEVQANILATKTAMNEAKALWESAPEALKDDREDSYNKYKAAYEKAQAEYDNALSNKQDAERSIESSVERLQELKPVISGNWETTLSKTISLVAVLEEKNLATIGTATTMAANLSEVKTILDDIPALVTSKADPKLLTAISTPDENVSPEPTVEKTEEVVEEEKKPAANTTNSTTANTNNNTTADAGTDVIANTTNNTTANTTANTNANNTANTNNNATENKTENTTNSTTANPTKEDEATDWSLPSRGDAGKVLRGAYDKVFTTRTGDAAIDNTIQGVGTVIWDGASRISNWAGDTYRSMKSTPGGRVGLSAGVGLLAWWFGKGTILQWFDKSLLGKIPILGSVLKLALGVGMFIAGFKVASNMMGQGSGKHTPGATANDDGTLKFKGPDGIRDKFIQTSGEITTYNLGAEANSAVATNMISHDGKEPSITIWVNGEKPRQIKFEVDPDGNWVGQQGKYKFAPSTLSEGLMAGTKADGSKVDYSNSEAVAAIIRGNNLGQIVSNDAADTQNFDIRRIEFDFDLENQHIDLDIGEKPTLELN